MLRIINVDWLTLYCVGGNQFDIAKKIANLGYMIKDRQVSTRHFKTILDAYTSDNYPMFEIQAEPTSLKRNGGIWRDGACLIKVNNRHLYKDGTITQVYDSLKAVGIEVVAISRLDIAMDFQYFDNGLSPRNFIRNFHKNKYWKVGSKKFTAIGEIDENLNYEYIRFGSPTSAVKVYLYNKTKELNDVKDKAYIRALWSENGMADKDVWRLEISIKSDARHLIDLTGELVKSGNTLVNKETGSIIDKDAITQVDSKGKIHEVVPITIDSISDKYRVMSLYDKLIRHYFRFRYKETGVRKDRAKAVDLIKIGKGDENFRPTKVLKSHDAGRMDRMVINYLDKMVETNPELHNSIYDIRMALAEKFCIELRQAGINIENKPRHEVPQ